ncbi:GAT1 [Symbiodinium natans]|uniref:GAT1 protein n=1 Tax=Symbiodinium natans TaxID=878477 RepID=A0A812U6U7_9DINO|nr:GAT1 [Symbiodinium natans]
MSQKRTSNVEWNQRTIEKEHAEKEQKSRGGVFAPEQKTQSTTHSKTEQVFWTNCLCQAGDGCNNGKVEPSYVCEYQGRLGIETGCVGVVAADTNLAITFTADSCKVVCGDGIRHIVAGEECDDGNLIDGDGCSRDCRIEDGFTCPTRGWPSVLLTPCVPICGDGLRVAGEECDDNNTQSGDGCSPTCQVEIGWFCKRAGAGLGYEVCLQTCLNGAIDPGEDCDDANTFKNDGCANCIIEPGWSCEPIAHRFTSTSSGSYCVPICGDGFRIALGPWAEACDDGNILAGDGCDPSCKVELGWRTKAQATSTELLLESICGDGLVVGSEGCDDGNLDAGDGCSSSCQVERGFACTPEDAMTKPEAAAGPPFAARNRSVCVPVCGDGLVLVGSGEDENCRVEGGYGCGIQTGGTRSVCTPICGDGLLRAPEECDDANDGKGDGCSELCQLEQGYRCWPPGVACRQICGDFLRLEGEECDDGNLLLADGCDSSCHVEVGWTCRSYIHGATNATSVCSPICGDGLIAGAEACDDGNLVPGDGCDGNCQVEVNWVCCDPKPGSSGSGCVPGLAVDRELICGTPTCGNGRRDPGEGCDDANRIAGDGCGQLCQVEPGYACIPMAVQGPGRNVPDICEAVCGDGLLVLGEECDDGNVATGDGCGPNCLLEQQGTSCPPTSDGNGGVCRATCGDGVRGPVEECDDGNAFGGDGCSATCQVERGFTCSGGGLKSMDTCWPICGDGLRVDRGFAPTLAAEKLEGCDTGPVPSRGCDAATCQVRVGWTCARPEGQGMEVCSPVCGDGILVTPIEECDDMNLQPGDGCSPDCKVEAFFECSYDDFWLRSVCSVRCGDGRKHPSEACDDGNAWDEDGCSSSCQPELGFECVGGGLSMPSLCSPICGDGYEVFGEGCDDGNQNPWDGCDQFCQVEDGYHCTRAPKPGQAGASSACLPTCGDGLLNGAEECDESYTPPPGNTTEPQSVPCSKCRLMPEDVCGDFRRGPAEQCDDGNNVSGDGCSESCVVETGWSCSQGPSHLPPGVAPGDACRAICGDGIVVSTEACDDGNLRGDDGCTGDCRVESFFECFLPGAAELLEVPASVLPTRGPSASVCVSTKPPRLVGAHFDEAFVSLELNFDSNVAPLLGEEHAGGVATAVPAFPCEVLLDPLTMVLLGQEPSCWWKSRQSAAVAMGGSLGILPGSAVLLKAGVLRRYTFAKEVAPAQEVKADVPGGFIAPVLWPRPTITGPQMAPACADVTVLSSEYSQGFAGRMAMPPRWAVVAAFNTSAASWDNAEVQRIQRGMEMQFQDSEVYLPRQGVLLSLLDLEYDRSIRVGFIYRVCLRQQNMLDLVGIGCHNLEIVDLPIPNVVTAVPQHPMTLADGRWLQLEVKAELPQDVQDVARSPHRVPQVTAHVELKSGFPDSAIGIIILRSICRPGLFADWQQACVSFGLARNLVALGDAFDLGSAKSSDFCLALRLASLCVLPDLGSAKSSDFCLAPRLADFACALRDLVGGVSGPLSGPQAQKVAELYSPALVPSLVLPRARCGAVGGVWWGGGGGGGGGGGHALALKRGGEGWSVGWSPLNSKKAASGPETWQGEVEVGAEWTCWGPETRWGRNGLAGETWQGKALKRGGEGWSVGGVGGGGGGGDGGGGGGHALEPLKNISKKVASGPETWQGEVGAEWTCWGPETWQGKALKRLVGEGELGQVPGPKKEWGYVNYETISIS